MVVRWLQVAARMHGHIGWLVAVLAAHPAWFLERLHARRRLVLSLGATIAITLVGLSGAALYVPYRQLLRREVFRVSTALGYLFERKEHLAYASVLLTWIGAGLVLRATRRADHATHGTALRGARIAYAFAALFALVVAALGTWVSAHVSF